jgi:hypothetical protein
MLQSRAALAGKGDSSRLSPQALSLRGMKSKVHGRQGLFRLNRQFGVKPAFPSAIKYLHISESFFNQLFRHPGAAVSASGAVVKYNLLVFRDGSNPGFNIIGIDAAGAFNFNFTFFPDFTGPHVKQQKFFRAELCVQRFFFYAFNFSAGIAGQ